MRKRHNKRKYDHRYIDRGTYLDGTPRLRQCTGCRQYVYQERGERRWLTRECRCGRAMQNNCVGCGLHLWDNEGIKVWWGANQKEMCKDCAAKVPPTALVEAAKYSNMRTGP